MAISPLSSNVSRCTEQTPNPARTASLVLAVVTALGLVFLGVFALAFPQNNPLGGWKAVVLIASGCTVGAFALGLLFCRCPRPGKVEEDDCESLSSIHSARSTPSPHPFKAYPFDQEAFESSALVYTLEEKKADTSRFRVMYLNYPDADEGYQLMHSNCGEKRILPLSTCSNLTALNEHLISRNGYCIPGYPSNGVGDPLEPPEEEGLFFTSISDSRPHFSGWIEAIFLYRFDGEKVEKVEGKGKEGAIYVRGGLGEITLVDRELIDSLFDRAEDSVRTASSS